MTMICGCVKLRTAIIRKDGLVHKVPKSGLPAVRRECRGYVQADCCSGVSVVGYAVGNINTI